MQINANREIKNKENRREIIEKVVMEIKVEGEESTNRNQQRQPLLGDQQITDTKPRTPIQKAIKKTFKGTAHLANLLPTGTVLSFQLISPVFTNEGQCDTVSRYMTQGLVALCGISCLLVCFTDSFRNEKGKVYYGLATFRGLWVIDGSATIAPELKEKYRLKCIDFLHAFMSVLVFVVVVSFDQNVVKCLYPTPSEETKQLLMSLPIGIGVISSMLFMVFPTKRHGIGFPLSTH